MSLHLLKTFQEKLPTKPINLKKLTERVLHRYRLATGYYDSIIKKSRDDFNQKTEGRFYRYLHELEDANNTVRSNILVNALRSTDRFPFVDSARLDQLWWPYGTGLTPYEDAPCEILSILNIPPLERHKHDKEAYKQTCSQPSLVLFMLYLLHIQPGMKVLEIWGGCGYAATLAAKAVGNSWQVVSIEYFQEVHDRWIKNLQREFGDDHEKRVNFLCGDGSCGVPQYGPYNAIFLSAGIGGKFSLLHIENQLVEWGRVIVPPKEWPLQLYIKRDWKLHLEWEWIPVWFVPMRWKNSDQ